MTIEKYVKRGERILTLDVYQELDFRHSWSQLSPPFPGANFSPSHRMEVKFLNKVISTGMFYFTTDRIILAENNESWQDWEFKKSNPVSIYYGNATANQIALKGVLYKSPGFLSGERFFLSLRDSKDKFKPYFAFTLRLEYSIACMKNLIDTI